jgi:hypothetical protein
MRWMTWRAISTRGSGHLYKYKVLVQVEAVQVEPMTSKLKAPGTKRFESKLRQSAVKFCISGRPYRSIL